MSKMLKKLACIVLCVTFIGRAFATNYPLPPKGDDIIGHVYTVHARIGDNFDKIAQRYDIGFFDLIEANPGIRPYQVPLFAKINIPAEYILPKTRQGIVVNLAGMRLYYFPKNKHIVETFPIGIGQVGEKTPTGHYYILQKLAHPIWHPPLSVRKRYEQAGVYLPKEVPSTHANPLGYYALRLNIWSYLIHGTNEPYSVGKRTTAGCMHLYPKNIKYLFSQVAVKTPVTIENNFYKLGWKNHQLYLEVEEPLSEQAKKDSANLTPIVASVNRMVGKKNIHIAWKTMTHLALLQNGIPTQISV